MTSPLPIPDDLKACHELIQNLLSKHAAQEQQLAQLARQHNEIARQNDELLQRRGEQERVLAELEQAYTEVQQDRDALREELLIIRRWAFSRRSERFVEGTGQRHLFDLPAPVVEAHSSEAPAAVETEPIHHKRRAPRKLNFESLPQQRFEHTLSESEKQCTDCGREMTRIGEDESRVLQYTPAKLELLIHVLPKYACSCCKQGVVSPEPPPRTLPRCLAGPGLISQIIVSKFGDHLPLYRQEDIFTRFGLTLPRSTLCDWVRGAAELLQPLADLMHERVSHSDILWTDDTPVRVLDAETPNGSLQGRFWAYIAEDAQPYTVYDFTLNWSREGPAKFLSGWRGFLQADAYSGYDGLARESEGAIVHVACGAHIRRKFIDAKGSAPRACAEILEWFRQLYDIEDRGRELPVAERCSLRCAESRPILAKMKLHLDTLSTSALPKSKLGIAVSYARSQWDAFCRYTEDGRLSIDNNVSERTLRAQAIGRKNWLFLGHKDAGPRAAVLCTILASAKRHHLEPWAYVTDVLMRLHAEADALESLLPDHWAAVHPEHVMQHRLNESRQRRSRQQAQRAHRRHSR